MKIYLINLDEQIQRLEFVHQQIVNLNIEYIRYSALRGGSLPSWLNSYFYDSQGLPLSQLSPGEIGCYASHLDLMRMVAEAGEPALILEDDIRIVPEFLDLLHEMMALTLEWDILRISSQPKGTTIGAATLSHGYRIVKYLRVPANTGAYIIKPAGARKFLEWRKPRWRPVDQDLRRVWENKLLTIGIDPQPIIQNVLPSSIDAMGGRVIGAKKYARDFKLLDRLRGAIFSTKYILAAH